MENKVFFEPILISNVHSLAPSFYDWSTESVFVDLMKHIKSLCSCLSGFLLLWFLHCVSVILVGSFIFFDITVTLAIAVRRDKKEKLTFVLPSLQNIRFW